MRVTRYKLLALAALVLAIGVSAVVAEPNAEGKPFKNLGTLTVRTAPASYPVKVDGQFVGMSGVGSGTEFLLAPGIHTVEVTGPNGSMFKREVEIRKDRKHCVCLKVIEETISRNCPYRFHLEGPEAIEEGDLVTFSAVNEGTAPVPIRYDWNVSNGSVTSGKGTPTITVDSSGLGAKTITATLDVNDDVYDNKCRQTISVPTQVRPTPTPVATPNPFRCDEFQWRTPDESKARFDNCIIQVQNTPDAQMYIIINPGNDSRASYDRLEKLARDYIVNRLHFDPRRLVIVKGPPTQTSTFVMWIVPPGANPPPI
ncbi:MAG TPA: hypothetical protein VL501_09465 [Pyrinomonadaceae bacterium]|nr:hypothetical protein [Pyrinomonadaceae bacterium]